MTIKPGQWTHYYFGRYTGDAPHIFSCVLKVTPKTATIALWDSRQRKIVSKRVALTSLTVARPDYCNEAFLRIKMKQAGIVLAA